MREGRILLATVAVIFIGAFAYWALSGGGPGTPNSGPGPVQSGAIPEQLAGLEQVQLVTGEEARRQVDQLHGLSIPVKDAYVVTYAGGQEKVVLWVTVSGTAREAEELLSKMVEKMQDTENFTPPQAFQVRNQVIYSSSGIGMNHYFFARGKELFWVAVSSSRDADIVAEVIHTF